jgi:hypothetical protein
VKFQVVWTPRATDLLADIWLAAHAIDQTLADDVGRIVFDTVREYNQPPLGIEFEVIIADARVFVLTVWDLATGRPNSTGN